MSAAQTCPTPCWYCRHFVAIDARDERVACALVGHCAQARTGCARFEREPGVDDDGWSPLAVPPAAAAARRARPAGVRAAPAAQAPARRPARGPRAVPTRAPTARAADPFGGLFDWNDDA